MMRCESRSSHARRRVPDRPPPGPASRPFRRVSAPSTHYQYTRVGRALFKTNLDRASERASGRATVPGWSARLPSAISFGGRSTCL